MCACVLCGHQVLCTLEFAWLPNVVYSRVYATKVASLSLQSSYLTGLMDGVGGIGCELLKPLALTGFKEVHIVSSILLLENFGDC